MTIFAISSGNVRAGVSVIRVSGPEAKIAVLSILKKNRLPKARYANLNAFFHPVTDDLLDRGLLLWFPAPASFTGEDVAEFHIHGGRAVVNGFLDALSLIPDLRPAEPGEFTRRAYDNGKMDLTVAEGLADLINAETDSQKKQALRQMDGELGNLYEKWRHEIISAMAYLEADIDFSDEEIPDDVASRVQPIIAKLYEDVHGHLNDKNRGERLRDGLQTVILGAPNAGKSTLLNYLSKREVAIVSDIAGTTRDVLEVNLDISGFPVTLIDTAGLRESRDVIEMEGVRRAVRRAEDADLKIVIIDALNPDQLEASIVDQIDDNTMILMNKCDVKTNYQDNIKTSNSIGKWSISAKSGLGLDNFLMALEKQVKEKMELTEMPSITRSRHRFYLQSCSDHLNRFLTSDHFEIELLSEDLRMAARELGKITGSVDVEEVLEKIFSEFCIGK